MSTFVFKKISVWVPALMLAFVCLFAIACGDEDSPNGSDGDTSEAEEDSRNTVADDLFANNRLYIPSEPMPLSFEEATNYCRSGRFNDTCGWRLPTIVELRSLIDGCPSNELGGTCAANDVNTEAGLNIEGCEVCETGDPDTCLWDSRMPQRSCPQAFWTSAAIHSSPPSFATVHFHNAEISTNWDMFREGLCHIEYGKWDSQLADVLCVKDEQESECATKRFPRRFTETNWTVEDEIVHDSQGLSWTRTPNTNLSHSEALSLCEGLELGGFDDWRLPDVTKLRTLIVGCQHLVAHDSYYPDANAFYDPYGTCCVIAEKHCLSTDCDFPMADGFFAWDDWCACTITEGYADGCYWERNTWAGGCATAFWSTSAVGDQPGKHWALHFGDPATRETNNWSGPQIAPMADSDALAVRCVRGSVAE